MSKIWKVAGFLPFIAVVFINAFVDLGHKITIQNTLFNSYDGSTQMLFAAIVNALILFPYILFFTPSGYLSDKYPKNKVMRIAAWAAVGITLAITYCYYNGLFWEAFGLTFLLAIQSALYSPSKYGFIKDISGKNLLSPANGAVQATTIIAILFGIVAFSFAYEVMIVPLKGIFTPETLLSVIAPLGWVLVAGSILEVVLAYKLPTLQKTNNELKLNKRDYLTGKLLKKQISGIYNNQLIWLSIVGITIFWSISQVMLAAYPAFAKESLGETSVFAIQLSMAMSGIGIVVGSIIAGRISKNYIETGLIPVGAIGVAIGLWILPGLSNLTEHAMAFFFVGLSGALFTIPLHSLIQYHADDKSLGQVLAGSNFIQNIGMVAFLGLTIVASIYSVPGEYLFYFLAAVAAAGAIYTVVKMPFSLVRIIIGFVFAQRYRMCVEGFKNIPEKGGVLLLGNHVSFVDWAIIQMACPRQVRFVMEKSYYNIWYLTWFFKIMGVVPISKGQSKDSLIAIGSAVNSGDVVCLFPEGKLSRHGQINEFKSGFQRAAQNVEKGNGVIIPFYLRGLWGSSLSKASKGFKYLRKPIMKRDIVIAFGEAIDIHSTPEFVKRRVQDTSFTAWKGYCDDMPTIPNKWIETAKKNITKVGVHDAMSGDLSYHRLLVGSIALSKDVISRCKESQNVGILLPASSGSALMNMGALLAGKTVVNVNFSAAPESLASGLEQAEIKTIYTSKLFIKKLEKKDFDLSWSENIEMVFMEDLMKSLKAKKIKMMSLLVLTRILPSSLIKKMYSKSNDNQATAAILFSSGSEGAPKGVMLSHRNMVSNVEQISDVLNIQEDDVVLSSLPPFHAFGLTATTFMPLLDGIPMATSPDPTDALTIGKVVAKHKVSIMCGTSTFLNLYTRNRKVIPLMFESLRIVVSGAERLKPEVRKSFSAKFGKAIYEGFGATETTPVACVNVPDHLDVNHWDVHTGQKEGTVGMALPGTTVRIVDLETMEELLVGEDGLILIGGHQVMQGYLNQSDKTANVIVEVDNIRWYKTGDKGHVDKNGFVTIVDRYSRFAKIAGEMVSLGAVEGKLQAFIELNNKGVQFDVVAAAVPDDKKGEVVIALVSGDIDVGSIRTALSDSGIAPLMRPAAFYSVDSIPLLGSGKVNLSELNKVAKELHIAKKAA